MTLAYAIAVLHGALAGAAVMVIYLWRFALVRAAAHACCWLTHVLQRAAVHLALRTAHRERLGRATIA